MGITSRPRTETRKRRLCQARLPQGRLCGGRSPRAEMNRLFRSNEPGRADYIGLAVFVVILSATFALLLV